MPQQAIPLGSTPYASPWTSVGRERCENLYLERSGSETAKTQEFYIRIPGLRRKIASTNSAACRGMFTASSGRVFAAFGQGIFEILANWTASHLFDLTTFEGPVRFCENGEVMLVVDGAEGWTLVFGTGVVERIDPDTDGNEGFPRGATHCVCLDTYFLVNDPRTNRYNWSNAGYSLMTSGGIAGSGGHWNGLNVAKKIARPDNIVALSDSQNMVWLFGASSIEVHYDSGDFAGGVWKRYESAIIEIGCLAPSSPAKYANNVFWIGFDKMGTVGIFTNDGFTPRRISVRGIEQALSTMEKIDDAIGFTFAENGHAFYLLHFPTGDRTFVFDIVTGTWHERTFLFREQGSTHRWRGMFPTMAFGSLIFGDNSTNAVHASDQFYFQNDDPQGSGVNYIRSVKTTPIGFQSGRFVRYLSVQPIFAQGQGLAMNTAQGVGEDPTAELAYSDDSGESWTQERSVSIGRRGLYSKRSRLTMLGSSRNRVWRISCTSPVRFLIVGLLVDMRGIDR